MALRNETFMLPGEKESRSENTLTTANEKKVGIRVRERRAPEPAISNHDHNVSNDFPKT